MEKSQIIPAFRRAQAQVPGVPRIFLVGGVDMRVLEHVDDCKDADRNVGAPGRLHQEGRTRVGGVYMRVLEHVDDCEWKSPSK